MSLAPDQMLDQYRLIEKIGEGGMGVVWKARDTTLDRMVALKVLPREVAGDPERLARFEREAKAVAALSHPNIVAIHGFGRQGEVVYAAMELLEGESLRETLDRGPLPPTKALDVASQVAIGLDAAHAKGISHRDLKPENVFLAPDGRARILDFGLAGVALGDGASSSILETRAELTGPGTIMGTVGYMSPEQVQGAAADTRSDIFALGVMLHEMLTGDRPFDRPTAAETMTAILREDPPPAMLGHRPAPLLVSRTIERCLQKSAGERFQSARDLSFALDSARTDSGASLPSAPAFAPPTRKPARAWWLVLPVAALAFAAGWLWRGEPPPIDPPRVTQLTFTGDDQQPDVSPDGRLIAFTSTRGGVSRIWLRQVSGGGEQPLTEGPDWRPRFSPDGSSVLFMRDSEVTYSAYRVAVVGGQPRRLIDDVTEVEWSPDGRRAAFIRTSRSESSGEGSMIGLLDLETREETILHRFEDWDLFGLAWAPDASRISAVKLRGQGSSGRWRLLLVDPDSEAKEELTIGHPLGLISGVEWADPKRLLLAITPGTLTGTPFPSEVIRYDLRSGEQRTLFWAPGLFPFSASLSLATQLSVLDDTSVVFDSFQRSQPIFLMEMGREGRRRLAAGNSIDRQPSYHPDGSRILFTSTRSGNVDLFSYEIATGELLQLTDHPTSDWDGAYTPDGSSILFSSDRTGNLEIWMADVDGSNPRQITQDGVSAENPTMTRDGRWILYAGGKTDEIGISLVRPDGSEVRHLASGRLNNPELSPDGRYALFIDVDTNALLNRVRVIEVETGEMTAFEGPVSYQLRSSRVTYGRGRWMPDGNAVVYIGLDDEGNTGLWIQDFHPDRDTLASRRPLLGFDGDLTYESFGISPDGRWISVSAVDENWMISRVDGLPPLRAD